MGSGDSETVVTIVCFGIVIALGCCWWNKDRWDTDEDKQATEELKRQENLRADREIFREREKELAIERERQKEREERARKYRANVCKKSPLHSPATPSAYSPTTVNITVNQVFYNAGDGSWHRTQETRSYTDLPGRTRLSDPKPRRTSCDPGQLAGSSSGFGDSSARRFAGVGGGSRSAHNLHGSSFAPPTAARTLDPGHTTSSGRERSVSVPDEYAAAVADVHCYTLREGRRSSTRSLRAPTTRQPKSVALKALTGPRDFNMNKVSQKALAGPKVVLSLPYDSEASNCQRQLVALPPASEKL